jgi:hypothetical protein
VDGIHYLQRTVGILVFQPVIDEFHVSCGKTGYVRLSFEEIGRKCTICLMREPKTKQGVKREGGIANPRGSVIPVESVDFKEGTLS